MSSVEQSLEQRILKALEEVRPFLQGDGGDIALESIQGDVVKVRFFGNCVHCTISQLTLKNGVEMTIKRYAPEIKEVISIG